MVMTQLMTWSEDPPDQIKPRERRLRLFAVAVRSPEYTSRTLAPLCTIWQPSVDAKRKQQLPPTLQEDEIFFDTPPVPRIPGSDV